jgi:hypothetical protein
LISEPLAVFVSVTAAVFAVTVALIAVSAARAKKDTEKRLAKACRDTASMAEPGA